MAATHGKIAKRYAKALFELSQPGDFEPRRKALRHIAEDIKAYPEFASALRNPGIPPSRREAMVRDLCAVALNGDQVFANFVATMLVNNRISALVATAQMYDQMIEQFLKVLSLEVTTALAVSEDDRRSLQERIQKLIPSQYASLVSIAWHQDKTLIGGMIVKAGDKILDGSLAGSLERVGRALS